MASDKPYSLTVSYNAGMGSGDVGQYIPGSNDGIGLPRINYRTWQNKQEVRAVYCGTTSQDRPKKDKFCVISWAWADLFATTTSVHP